MYITEIINVITDKVKYKTGPKKNFIPNRKITLFCIIQNNDHTLTYFLGLTTDVCVEIFLRNQMRSFLNKTYH